MLPLLASAIFVLGYAFIALETKVRVSKSAFALAMGGILWILLTLHDPHLIEHEVLEVFGDIFNVVIFLLAAMSLVEILVHYRLFDIIREKLFALRLTETHQFILICAIAWVFSAVIDNLTTTIVMIQIARKFFRGDNLLVAAVGIVIAANAGGAFSPIGDVTTIMLWLAGKFTAWEILSTGFLPCVVLLGVALLMLTPKIKPDNKDIEPSQKTVLSRSETFIIALVLLSFSFPILVKFIHLPPIFGLLLGVGLAWIAVDFFKSFPRTQTHTHLTASIEHLIQKTDISSIKFFIGILLSVSALGLFGVLDTLSGFVYGAGDASLMRVIGGNVALGFLSAILDNIPLTAIAIEILGVSSASLWVLLAICVGTGGSLLVIGSAAGVVAMGMVKELTFGAYFRIAFLPALVSFLAAVAVWGTQYALLGPI